MGSFCFSCIGLILGVRASLCCCELIFNSQEQFLSPFIHYKNSDNTVQHSVCIFFASKCWFYLCPLHRLTVTSRVWYPSTFWLCWSAQASRRCLPSFVLNHHRNSDAQHLWQWNVPCPCLPRTSFDAVGVVPWLFPSQERCDEAKFVLFWPTVKQGEHAWWLQRALAKTCVSQDVK